MKAHGELREADWLGVLVHLKKTSWIFWLRCGHRQVAGSGLPSRAPNIEQPAAVSPCRRWNATLSETSTSTFDR